MTRYHSLTVCSLTPEQHSRTCGYWYTVLAYGHTAHTAFAHRAHLDRWLADRNMSLVSALPDHGQHGVSAVKGEYSVEMHNSYDAFYSLQGIDTRVMSNGDYTLGLLTSDSHGHVTVHHLNPNCRRRPVYPYQETRAIYG